MPDPAQHDPAQHEPAQPEPAEPAPAPGGGAARIPLEQLEADLAAVESALATLDRIESEGRGGEAAAAEIAAVIDARRFPLPEDGSELVGDGLVDQ